MKSFYYFLALVIPIILASCNNRGEINADTIEKILDTVSNTFINKPEHYGFGLYRDTSIRIADGIEVEFNSKSLLAIGGIKPYSGLVDMSFIVVDQLNEFLKEFKSTTTSRGELMKTKGYLRIELRDSGGKKLFVDQLYPLKLKIHKKYELDAYHWYQSDSCGYGWGMPQNFTKVYNTDTLQDLNFMVSTEAESDTVKAYNLMGHRVTGGDVISYYVGMKYVDVNDYPQRCPI